MSRTAYAIPLSCLVLALTWVLVQAPTVRADDDLRDEIRALNTILGDEDQADRVKELAKDPELARKMLALAKKMADDQPDRFNFSGAIILANLSQELQDWDVGDKFYRIAVDRAKVQNNSRRIVITYLTWVDLLTEAKRFEAAEKTCQEILELDGDDDGSLIPIGKAYALRSLVRLAAIQGKVKDAFRKLERVNDEIPFHAETKAWLLQFTGKYDDAEEIYLRLYQRLDPDDERLESEREKFARILGSMYGDMGDVDKATKMLRPLLLKKPDDAGLNNDLGYIWADLKHNVDEAAAMIKKAVDAEPDNSSFLDSYGWALFRQGKLEEARDFLKRATAKPRGQNIEILDHYAEVLWALGERDEAKAIWKKAVEVATPAHRDQQRKQAIERRLGSGGESKDGPAR